MSKSLECEFDELLLEAWERCTDDEKLRASPAYGCVRRILAELTSCSARGEDQLERLERAVCAIRAGDRDGSYAELQRYLEQDLAAAAAADARRPSPRQQQQAQLQLQAARPSQADRPSADCVLMAALAAADECPSLPRFYRDVAAYTCDRGALLMRVTKLVLSDFRTFADTVLGYRVTQIGMVLGREQTAARGRYDELTLRAFNRAQLAVSRVRDLMPTFDWNRYISEPGYMRLVVASSRCAAQSDDADDGDEARGKGLLYQLNWLRSEIDRADAENRCLQEQHAGLVAELAGVNREIAQAQCRAADDVARLSDELEELRARSAGQMCAIDKLMESIQISMENSKTDGVDMCSPAVLKANSKPQPRPGC